MSLLFFMPGIWIFCPPDRAAYPRPSPMPSPVSDHFIKKTIAETGEKGCRESKKSDWMKLFATRNHCKKLKFKQLQNDE